jgi:uncharacterized protein
MNIHPKTVPSINPLFAAYALRIRRSRIQGWGVYAAETIPPRRKVIEYTGERLSFQQARARLRKICQSPRTRRLSIIRLNRYWRIDGAFGGSGAEYINHCCDPNLQVRGVRGHILLFSLRRIPTGKELTYDYRLHPKTFRVPCHCSTANCRGTLNRK